VFLTWTAPVDAIPAAFDRIVRSVRRIVFVSSPHKTPHPFFQQPNPVRLVHEQIDRLIEFSGLQWTILRPGIFAANALHWWAPQIRARGVVRWPYLSVATAPTDERDIAAVATRALTEDGHGGDEYVVTGPQSLTQAEQLSIIGQAIGRSIPIEEISAEKARRELLVPIPSPVIIDMLLDAWAAAAGQPAFVTSTLADITGSPARTFSDWANVHAADFL
jgi:uncharacterized protein YbjT (DUF2867 family)